MLIVLLATNVLLQLLHLMATTPLVVLIHWPSCTVRKEEGEVLFYAMSDQWDIGLVSCANFVIKEMVQLISENRHLMQAATCYSVQFCLGEMSLCYHCKLLCQQAFGQLQVHVTSSLLFATWRNDTFCDPMLTAQSSFILGTKQIAEQQLVLHGNTIEIETKISRDAVVANPNADSIPVTLWWIGFQLMQLGLHDSPPAGTIVWLATKIGSVVPEMVCIQMFSSKIFPQDDRDAEMVGKSKYMDLIGVFAVTWRWRKDFGNQDFAKNKVGIHMAYYMGQVATADDNFRRLL